MAATEIGERPSGAARQKLVDSLLELGFSVYEARTYSGLVGQAPQTGYAVSKETQVPQSKVYETLGRLAERGAVVQISDHPAKFAAVPPHRLLAQMEVDFRNRLLTAELEIARLNSTPSANHAVRPFWESNSWASIEKVAAGLADRATSRLFVSGHSRHLGLLTDSLLAADTRGVRIDALCFGEPPFELVNGFVVRHTSTERIIYPHHQARHLAIVSDNEHGLWALAREGDDWQAIWAEYDNLLPALIKGFVRHDIYVQRTFHDFSEELLAKYGAGLEGLVKPTIEAAATAPNSDRERGIAQKTA